MGRTGPVRRADSRVSERPPERRRRRPVPAEQPTVPARSLVVPVHVAVLPCNPYVSAEIAVERVEAAINGRWVQMCGTYVQLQVVEQTEPPASRARPRSRLAPDERHRIVTAWRRGVAVPEIAMLTGRSHDVVERAIAGASTIPAGPGLQTDEPVPAPLASGAVP